MPLHIPKKTINYSMCEHGYGCDQKGRRLVGKLELKKRVTRGFLNDVTEGLFLIWKGKEFKRTDA